MVRVDLLVFDEVSNVFIENLPAVPTCDNVLWNLCSAFKTFVCMVFIWRLFDKII